MVVPQRSLRSKANAKTRTTACPCAKFEMCECQATRDPAISTTTLNFAPLWNRPSSIAFPPPTSIVTTILIAQVPSQSWRPDPTQRPTVSLVDVSSFPASRIAQWEKTNTDKNPHLQHLDQLVCTFNILATEHQLVWASCLRYLPNAFFQ